LKNENINHKKITEAIIQNIEKQETKIKEKKEKKVT